jgi:putative DNA primase/helicase
LLNCPEVAVDLRTGEGRVNDPADLCSKIAKIAPALPGTPHPLWDRFLERVLPDPEVRAYLQRFLGYSLTGLTEEHALLFLWGTGRNGKGVLLNTVSRILSDYAVQAPFETFMANKHARHETELAMLNGARLVTVPEVPKGARWNEARIKAVTGGDPIRARFMHRDYFQFDPQFKIIISGNHRPHLSAVDEAVRARFNLVHFGVTIPEDERDPKLIEKLAPEHPAILRWLIDGCREWQRIGLNPPTAVTATTEEYLAGEDTIGNWLDDATEARPAAWESTADLFTSYTNWAKAAGEWPGSKKEFSQTLIDRGFKPDRRGHGRTRGFTGIRITPPPQDNSRYGE